MGRNFLLQQLKHTGKAIFKHVTSLYIGHPGTQFFIISGLMVNMLSLGGSLMEWTRFMP